MIVILTAPSGRKWKISPLDNGLCFQVFKEPLSKTGKNGKKITAEWLFTGKYPITLSDAIRTTVNMIIADPEQPEVLDIKAKNLNVSIAKRIDRYVNAISYKLRGIIAASACEWEQDEDGIWQTNCLNSFILIEGLPSENKMLFCPYCGKTIEETHHENK